MLYKEYFKNKKLSQEIFNKKINWFYDIKSILYQENNNFKKETQENAKILKKDYFEIRSKKFRKLNGRLLNIQSLNKSKFLKKDKNFKEKYIQLFNYLEKKKNKEIRKIFLYSW